MRNGLTACERTADAVGCAFSALEPDEENVLRAHLPHCVACRQALEEALEVVAALGAAAPQVEPPAGLRAKILDAARTETARTETARTETAPTGSAPFNGNGHAGSDPVWSAATPLRPVDTSPERGTDRRPEPAEDRPVPDPRARRRVIPAAFALVAAVVLGLGLVLARAVLPTETGGGPAGSALAARADQVVADARSRDPNVRTAILHSAGGQPAAVVLDSGADPSAPPRLVSLALPSPGPDRDFVVWATGTPGQAPVAVATVDAADGASRPVGPSGAVSTATPPGWAVSTEPVGPVPTTPSTVLAVGSTV